MKIVNKTIDDVGSEISGLYNCAFEFKNAEMNLQAVAKLAENTVMKNQFL